MSIKEQHAKIKEIKRNRETEKGDEATARQRPEKKEKAKVSKGKKEGEKTAEKGRRTK
jgi:hypothetical protein